MDLRKLQYFVSIAECGNFTIAAEKNYISQSALSKQISDLEYELRISLFTRSKGRAFITPEGKALLPYARNILSQSNDLAYQAKLLSKTSSGNLLIGYSGTYEYDYICHIIHCFSKKHPHSNLSFKREHHGTLNYLIRSGKYDVVFTIQDTNIRGNCINSEIGWIPIIKCKMCVIVSISHKLAAKEFVTLKDLEDEQQIIVSKNEDSVFHPIISNAFAMEGLMSNYYPESPSNTHDALLLVLNGKGYIFSTPYLAIGASAFIKELPVHGRLPDLEFGIAYRKDRENSLMQSFLETIYEVPADKYFNNTLD